MADRTPAELARFADWVESWWQKFSKMKPYTAYEVANCAKDTELFIEVCKDFIDRGANGNQYEFSNDYKYFKRFTK